ncbi:hypothetical protein [Polymorphobacter sp.]|uniref:hypothetical protein n=1 Tax=Polymorphobacter sp. TaxID=1909290 RepID=UPI003F709C69
MTDEQAPETRLDVMLALYRTLAVLRANFAALLLGGVVLVSLPSLLVNMLAPEAGYSADMATVLTTARAVLAMLFMAQVSWGVVARLGGLRLAPSDLVREGLRRAQPGLKVALLAGAGIVLGLTVQLFAQHGTPQGFVLQTLLLTLALWALCTLMPAVPAAVIERLGPIAALRRAAALTAGNRDRTLLLGLLAGLAIAPSGLLIRSIGPAPWLSAVFELFAWGLAATLPAVVYAGLRATE